jgi:phosphatidylinositol-3-phosphatase
MKRCRRTAKLLSALVALCSLAVVSGCTSDPSSSKTASSDASTPQSRASTPTAARSSVAGSAKTSGGPTKVLTFIEENHSLTQMQDGMPYLNGLAQQYAYATNFTAITHPSLPNYLAIAGGSTFGVTDDGPPSANSGKVGGATSVFDQALASGHTAKTYAESMPSNCDTSSQDLYAVKHNPWAYFTAGHAGCEKFDVPIGDPNSGALATDIATGNLPNVGMVIPNLCNDAHNDSCSLTTADEWLKGWLPQILSSGDFTSGRLVVVITADEDDRSMGNKILTVVLSSAEPRGQVVANALTHYSLSGFYSEIIGATALGEAAGAPSLKDAFGL